MCAYFSALSHIHVAQDMRYIGTGLLLLFVGQLAASLARNGALLRADGLRPLVERRAVAAIGISCAVTKPGNYTMGFRIEVGVEGSGYYLDVWKRLVHGFNTLWTRKKHQDNYLLLWHTFVLHETLQPSALVPVDRVG